MSYRNNKQEKNHIKIISKNLLKYNKTKEQLSQNVIKKLIFHKKSHFTSLFIEYLIWDDFQEFLTKYYKHKYFLKKILLEPKNKYNLAIVDDIGHKLLFQNYMKKKLLKQNPIIKEKKIKNMKIIHSEKKLNSFFHILPQDISGELKIFEIGGKNLKNESETIDNINANNDISMSIDLRLNKKYDSKILDKNSAFVKGKNGENDKEIMKVIKFLKPIHNENKYKTSEANKIINRNRALGYENSINISKNNNKCNNHSNNHSESKTQIKNKTSNLKNNYNNKKRIKCNSLNNNNEIKNKENSNYKNIFKIDIKKSSPSPFIDKSKSKKKSKNKNTNTHRNIILINRFVNNTTSTKANTKINDTFNANNSKNKINNINNIIKSNNQIKKQNNKILSLKSNLPYNSKINGKIIFSNSNSNSKKSLKNDSSGIKKIIIDKKINKTNIIRKEKYINKKYNYLSPEIRRKNNFNTKKFFNENKLFLEKIIYPKKEKSFDNKHSMKESTKYSSNKLSPAKSKKIL